MGETNSGPQAKEKLVGVKVTGCEHGLLRALAAHEDTTITALVREDGIQAALRRARSLEQAGVIHVPAA